MKSGLSDMAPTGAPQIKEASRRMKVAVLVDLPRSAEAGGHVKCWERLAAAAVKSDLPLDLTVYFSGKKPDEILSPYVRLRHLPPVFSTARLKFLPYVPDHTDLAPHHKALAKELTQYDLIHTTDAYFAFSRTASRVAATHKIPLVTSLHTDTPSYTRIFTRKTLETLFGNGFLSRLLINKWKMPERKERGMQQKLANHMRECSTVLYSRDEDKILAESIKDKSRTRELRLGIDKDLFNPAKRDRAGIERDYAIPPKCFVFLFVGRVDIGKNIYTLAEAVAALLAEGAPIHLIVAGKGPASSDVHDMLGSHVTLTGFVEPKELARFYASVDAFALCSEVEIRSMAVTEALASGCPVLASEKLNMTALFGNTPAVYPVGSGMEKWAITLSSFMQSTQMRTVMRQKAVEYAPHLLGWDTVLKEDLFPVWQRAVQQRIA